MKKYLFLAVLFLTPSASQAQSLTIDALYFTPQTDGPFISTTTPYGCLSRMTGEDWSQGNPVLVCRGYGVQVEHADSSGGVWWDIQSDRDGHTLIGDPGNGAGVRDHYVNNDRLRVLGNINAIGGTINTDTGLGIAGNTVLSPSNINSCGEIIGVVTKWHQCTNSINFNTSSTSFQNTGLSCSIAPGCDSDYIRISAVGTVGIQTSGHRGFATISRNGTGNLGNSAGIFTFNGEGSGAFPPIMDHPNTQASTTYNIQLRSDSTSVNVYGYAMNSELNYMLLENVAK